MSNSNFNTVSSKQTPLDPNKRVKYTMGLVLGVEEFEQEQVYLMERDRVHNRALHGYGTAAGLKVSIKKDSGTPKVMVTPGIAVNPRGDSICVPDPQCASLPQWLQENSAEIEAQLGSPAVDGMLSLYIVLCYKECETDNVPIPGAPCRTQEDTLAPSRIADHFQLKITTSPPEQVEEEYVRCFGKFLRNIEISERAVAPLDEDALLKKLREYFADIGSPPECPALEMGSPPGEKYYILPDNSDEILQAVFRVWVTEIRPELLRKSGACGHYTGKPQSPELCVLLAQLDVNVKKSGSAWQLDGDITDGNIIEDNRPILLHTRLLQEWLLCGRYSILELDTRTFATVFMVDDNTLRAWIHHLPLLNLLQTDSVYFYLNGTEYDFIDVYQFAGTNVFDLEFDNTTGDGSRFMKFNDRVGVRFDITRITENAEPGKTIAEVLETSEYDYIDRHENFIWSYFSAGLPVLNDLADVDADILPGSPITDQVLTWKDELGKWVPTDKPEVISVHNELTGRDALDAHSQYLTEAEGNALYSPLGHNHPHNHPHVLNSHTDVTITGAADGQILTRQGSKWVNLDPPQTGITLQEVADKLPVLPFVTITQLDTDKDGQLLLQLWFHLDAVFPGSPELKNIDLNLYRESRKTEGNVSNCAWSEFKNKEVARDDRECNVFLVSVDGTFKNDEFLRFIFHIDKMEFKKKYEGSKKLMDWILKRPIKWLGHDGGTIINAFYKYKYSKPQTRSGYEVVAAGQFDGNGNPQGQTLNNLEAIPVNEEFAIYNLNFDNYDTNATYIVKGTPLIGSSDEMLSTFEVLLEEEKLSIRVTTLENQPPKNGFMVEISQIL